MFPQKNLACNGLRGMPHAIIWTNVGLLLAERQWTKFYEILFKIQIFL